MDNNLKFRSMNLPDIFIDQDTPENMYKIANLDFNSIEEKVLDLLNSNIVLKKQK
jgi:1-deoxy-D-xylulose-5-phosphate synthase